MAGYRLGVDVGSTTIKLALMDGKTPIYSQYRRHNSDTRGAVSLLLGELARDCPGYKVTAAISGSGGMGIASRLGLPFIQEVLAGAKAAGEFVPECDVIIELGGEDAKITYMHPVLEQRMNGTCAGGTGAFIDQMAALLMTDAKGLDALAANHKRIYPIASRCGVFAKSDLQPLINEGAAHEDLAASVFQSVANQTVSGLAQGRPIRGNVVFLGGPLHFLPELRKRFVETLAGDGQTFICPENAQLFVAMGAAFLAEGGELTVEELAERLKSCSGGEAEIARIRPLFIDEAEREAFDDRHALDKAQKGSLENADGGLYLGIDAGSTTIKAVLINAQGELLYTYYGFNQGEPVGVAVEILKDIYAKLPKAAHIAYSCVTGYGEALIKTALQMDVGEIETLSHYKAAEKFCPGVDFIIDIGGQDMKCMKIKDGAIESIMLNEACSSGCGSFIQTFAKSLGMTSEQFAAEALKSEAPVDLGTRCTVFMNSRVKQAQKEGATVGDISAGLSYSVVRNALYKVIKLRNPEQMGSKIVVQGGTFNNDAILRCFELVSMREVIRPDIAGVMGAYGAALIAMERCGGKTSALIPASELDDFEMTSETGRCQFCQNHCRLTITAFPGGRKLISGNRCERGQGVVQTSNKLPNLYDYKYKRLFAHYKPRLPEDAPMGEIGLPRALNMYEDYPFWFTLFDALGFRVVLSGRSSHELYQNGMDTIPSESVCYPAKLAHGHIKDLLSKGVKTIFYPCVPYENKEYKGANNNYNCPIVTSYPDLLINNVEALREGGVRFLHPFINLAKPNSIPAQLEKTFGEGWDIHELEAAVGKAYVELLNYRRDVQSEGKRVVEELERTGTPAVVLAGRPYHVDPEINHGIPQMINSLGFAVLSEDSVAGMGGLERPIRVVDQWVYHSRLYEAAAFVSKHERIELVQFNSFGCGLDAVTTEQVQEILQAAGRLYTLLKIDEISSLGTARIRIRSLKAAQNERRGHAMQTAYSSPALKRVLFTKKMRKTHTVLAPQMSPVHFALIEKAFGRCGIRLKVLDKVTPADVEMGLKFVNNDACYPSILVTGQLINALLSGKYDPDSTTLMITQTGGGCRATNYIAFIRKALKDAGFEQVPVVSLNAIGSEPNPGFKLTPPILYSSLKAIALGDLLQTLLLRVRPYEVEQGSANRLFEKWLGVFSDYIAGGGDFRELVEGAAAEFDALPITNKLKPKVGIVGEILVKFHPGANNDAIGVIESEGGEAVLPGLMDFFLYGLYNGNFKRDNLGMSAAAAAAKNTGIALLEHLRAYIKRVLLCSEKFAARAPSRIEELAEKAQEVLQLGNCTGEGWFLTAEMIELIDSGVPNIICVQPFACLPNHITGKGMLKELRRLYPMANIVPVDYDPGASEVNQLNRIKLMMTSAFNNLKQGSAAPEQPYSGRLPADFGQAPEIALPGKKRENNIGLELKS